MSELQKNPGSGNTDSIDAFLGELIQSIKANETVVFCGAGISRHSGLPIVSELVPYILAKIGVTAEETQTIMNANLPFEAFMETLRGNSDVGRIFDIFDLGEPNTNHLLLAKLANARLVTTICTTNFDCLIEEAFDREGLARGKDYQVYYKEADFKRIPWNDNIIRLIKIHGSVEDRENMAITLGQVASQVLSSQRKAVIEHIFSSGPHRQVLVLGYSCSDAFDISPQIEAIGKNGKKVLLIDHPKNESQVKDLAEKQKKNPFHLFGESRWIVFDTDKLVEAVWNSCIAEKISPHPVIDKTAWQKYVEAWSSEAEEKYSEGNKYSIAGQIFYQVSEFKKTINYFEQALSIFREIGDKRGEEIVFGALGNVYENLGEYDKAIDNYEQALNIAQEINDKWGEGNWLGELGATYGSLGDNRKAIAYLEQALCIAKEIGNKKGEGIRLGNLGTIYRRLGEYRKAIGYCEQALNIARQIGDKQNEGNSINDLGVAYWNLGEYRKAIGYYEQALRIAREIGDKHGEGNRLGGLGNAYYSLGDYQKAIDYNEQALRIAKEVGDKEEEGAWLSNLGNAHYSLGDNRKAIDYYERALSIAKQISDKHHEGTILGNLGIPYWNLGENRKAIAYFEQALTIAREISDKQGEGSQLGRLGNAYWSLGDYWKAIDYFEQALSITRQIDDKQNEATWLGNLGSTYHRLGEYQKAIGYYEDALAIFRPMLGNGHPQVKLFAENLRKAQFEWKG